MNPVAGASRQRRLVREMLGRLESRGNTVELHQTSGAGHAVELARDAAGRTDAVIAVGGDGTVCEVVNGLAFVEKPDTARTTPLAPAALRPGVSLYPRSQISNLKSQISSPPLLIWPTGTENLVAKSLGFRPDAHLICSCLERYCTRTLDIGLANGRSFLVVAGVGFDAEVVHRVAAGRRGHITHLSYSGPIWRTFWEHRFPEIRVETDGLIWNGRGLVFVGNMDRYALGLPVVRDAVPDDGLLDLLILPCDHQFQLLGHSLRTLLRVHVGYKGVVYRHVEWVRITSDGPVPFEVDGDAAGALPLEVRVVPAAVRVLVPARAHLR